MITQAELEIFNKAYQQQIAFAQTTEGRELLEQAITDEITRFQLKAPDRVESGIRRIGSFHERIQTNAFNGVIVAKSGGSLAAWAMLRIEELKRLRGDQYPDTDLP